MSVIGVGKKRPRISLGDKPTSEGNMKLQQMNLAVAEPVGRTHNADLDFNQPAYDWALPVDDDNKDSSSAYERITQLELDSYRIALIPRGRQQRGADRNHSSVGRAGEFLLLPLTWKELMTHVRWEVGHPISTDKMHILEFADVRIDLLAMEVFRAELPIVLTTMEFKVLKFFVMNPNRVISRDELLNQVWGYENYPCTRTVDNHVMKLRQKLESDDAPRVHFRTVHGIGYKFIP
jgi:Transcriptional regulatory protein, C terminal